ncbi:MAG TPA: hydantoinase/oxoprolinase N-terminal domain-containing protein, partial [Chloroflexia bacterium]
MPDRLTVTALPAHHAGGAVDEIDIPNSAGLRIGVDVGGTFTDVVCIGADGATVLAKAATTPADQSEGVLDGLAALAAELQLTLRELLEVTERLVHGTTVATNA